MLKFRTMRAGAETSSQTRPRDPRCTHVGAILRRTSLDELPQLLNILRGEMSLVGPRPMVPELHLGAGTPPEIRQAYALRGRVRPGMTGWAQIHSLRGAIDGDRDLHERIKYDLFYIENWSLGMDLRILARTPAVVLGGKNAF
jgi:putative colanic acid biosynthesis UDP-glucose lipid carrier transferase